MPNNNQTTLDFSHAQNYHEGNFLIGNANKEAWEILQKNNITNINSTSYNIKNIIIYGDKSSGKTHLANIFAQNYDAEFISIEKIGLDNSENILKNSQKSWIIEDIENIIFSNNDKNNNPESTKKQEGFFHLLNEIKQRGDNLLLTCNGNPKNLNFSFKDINSRLSAFTAIKLQMPDDELLESILLKLFSDRQLKVNNNVIKYIIKHIERSYESAYKIVTEIDNLSLQQKRNITLQLVAKIF